MGPIGIFGGTFDPIHLGHLRTAQELADAASIEQVHFVPCGQPPHRNTPVADAHLRAEMVRAAVRDNPGFIMDDRELTREGRSYSVDTLESFRSEFANRPLCLFLGMDAFVGLPNWYRQEAILKLAHLVVAHRPGWQPPKEGAIARLLDECQQPDAQLLHRAQAGMIFVHPVSQLEISSSGIRALILQGGDPRYLVPTSVLSIMRKTNCYAEH